MLEAYSINQTVATNTNIPFTSVTTQKGCTALLNGINTIELNKAGVYEVTLDISGTPSAAGEANINMLKDGVVEPQATINIPLVAATASVTGSITTLVKVAQSNTCKCNTSSTRLQFLNTGVGLTSLKANVTVTKLC